jgi:pentose-5-phosphate-3-epimerase
VRDNMVPVEVQQGGIRNKQAQKIFGTGRHFRIMGSYVFRPVSPFFCKA